MIDEATGRRGGRSGEDASRGFTLVELLVSLAVLALLVLLATSLVNSAATITTLGHKRMDTDSQARQLLDRMAVDFAQMVKRSDVDYYFKSATNPQLGGNDQIAFYSTVPGYYPATGAQSPASLVAYRVNSVVGTTAFNKMERFGKGLVWNGVSATDTPVVFLPLTLGTYWPTATNSNSDPANYEVIGPQVFRFEYSYLLTDGTRSILPGNISGIAAIIVDIATIDPKSKALLSDSQIRTTVVPALVDLSTQLAPGALLSTWQIALDGITSLPRPAISGIRLYERYFYLSPPTL